MMPGWMPQAPYGGYAAPAPWGVPAPPPAWVCTTCAELLYCYRLPCPLLHPRSIRNLFAILRACQAQQQQRQRHPHHPHQARPHRNQELVRPRPRLLARRPLPLLLIHHHLLLATRLLKRVVSQVLWQAPAVSFCPLPRELRWIICY